MIKLIASDMDGTLLPEGTPDINPEIFEVILKLKKKGVIFAAASGRQYGSMVNVFSPIQDDIIFIAENGGYVVCRGYDMYRGSFDRALLEEVVDYMRHQDVRIGMVNTPEAGYTDCRDIELIEDIRQRYHFNMIQVDDVLKQKLDVTKAALYCKSDALEIAQAAEKQFSGRVKVMAAGDLWVDFMQEGIDKGTALAKIQQQLNIKVEETMAFGDNYNDIGMLERAGESYAMENAREGVKKAARHIAARNDQDGVLKVLKELLKSMEE
ncbi:MAG: HAD family hydrolase [Lachnospiraceae bacterium]|nr:HAD family hydrolase [Lachnospiraceae bacterium]